MIWDLVIYLFFPIYLFYPTWKVLQVQLINSWRYDKLILHRCEQLTIAYKFVCFIGVLLSSTMNFKFEKTQMIWDLVLYMFLPRWKVLQVQCVNSWRYYALGRINRIFPYIGQFLWSGFFLSFFALKRIASYYLFWYEYLLSLAKSEVY